VWISTGIISVSKLRKQWAKGLGNLRGVPLESSDDDTPSSGIRDSPGESGYENLKSELVKFNPKGREIRVPE
jgi:hypothetical protein